MGARNAAEARRAKAVERAKPSTLASITITVTASERNLERLAAYIMYADSLVELTETPADGPLPWETDAPPKPAVPLDINWEMVRIDVMKRLTAYVEQHGRDAAVAVLAAHGAERLSLIPQDQLFALRDALAVPAPTA